MAHHRRDAKNKPTPLLAMLLLVKNAAFPSTQEIGAEVGWTLFSSQKLQTGLEDPRNSEHNWIRSNSAHVQEEVN